MEKIDLHVHSTCSDGTFTPTELVRHALSAGLCAFALTDHDTTAGIEEAQTAAEGTGLSVISGIEFSTKYQKRDIHIVGLDFDWRAPSFQETLTQFQDSRTIRNREMIRLLAGAGIDISVKQMQEAFGNAVWTRAHFAAYLLEHGYVKTREEAFHSYIGDTAPCYVPRQKVTPSLAVKLIRQHGGIPILAHPMLYHFSEPELRTLVGSLKQDGLAGIEALYSTHTSKEEAFIRKIAADYGIAISGGSDFHGANKPDIALGSGKGNLHIPYSVYEHLKEISRKSNTPQQSARGNQNL